MYEGLSEKAIILKLREWKDLRLVALVTEETELSVTFLLFDEWEIDGEGNPTGINGDEGRGAAMLEGWIKWDGCSNWMTPSGEGYDIHRCDRKGLLDLGEAMARCWDWAAELISRADAMCFREKP